MLGFIIIITFFILAGKYGFWIALTIGVALFAVIGAACYIMDEYEEERYNKKMQDALKVAEKAYHEVQIHKRNNRPEPTKRRKWSLRFKESMYTHQDGKCAGCKDHFGIKQMDMDHITPLASGGIDIESNMQLLCKPCNQTKKANPINNFELYQMRKA